MRREDEGWQVIFCDPDNDAAAMAGLRGRVLSAVLSRLTPGFRHCFAARPMGDGGWLVINPHACRTDVFTVTPAVSERTKHEYYGVDYGQVLDRAADAGRAARLFVPQACPGRIRAPRPMTCVAVVGAVTGHPPPAGVWTPLQFYRWLIRQGAKPLPAGLPQSGSCLERREIMGGVFRSPSPPPPAPVDASLERRIEQEDRERERAQDRNRARRRNIARRGQRRPLLFDGYRGVDTPSDTLG